MSEPSSRWFYLQNGRRHGPVDLYGLVDLILKQELTEDTLVWHSGLSEWVKASEREEIRRELPPPVPLSARETALAAPMPVLEAEELEGLEDPLARSASATHEYERTDSHRRRHSSRKAAAASRRWLAVVLAVLVALMIGLWWLLKRINEVPPGQVIIREGRSTTAPIGVPA